MPNPQKSILIPLPDHDFDVTEVSVPWQVLTSLGYSVVFATEHGDKPPAADPLLLEGVIFGKLGAAPEVIDIYRQLEKSAEFCAPLAWDTLDVSKYDALLLPGGHAPGMRQYLSSKILREKVGDFWQLKRPVAAICHGVLVLARTVDPATGQSVLADRRTTCLPKYMERSAYYTTFWLRGRYYRTYPAYVEDEVKAALNNPAAQFLRGPRTLTERGTATNHRPAFVVEDGFYLSARWPGDAYLFAQRFNELIESVDSMKGTSL